MLDGRFAVWYRKGKNWDNIVPKDENFAFTLKDTLPKDGDKFPIPKVDFIQSRNEEDKGMQVLQKVVSSLENAKCCLCEEELVDDKDYPIIKLGCNHKGHSFCVCSREDTRYTNIRCKICEHVITKNEREIAYRALTPTKV